MKILKKNIKFFANYEINQALENDTSKFVDQVKTFCTSKEYKPDIYTKLKEYNLVEFEILQLLNLCPKQLIDLSLVIEEIEERYTEEKLEEILELFK
ncbi:DNA-directed RNA polymerase III subunit (RPC9) [Vairimorpha necatrix]|uniref:DNA-directed RNA polymerase III subunit RPC9 n=1 Tax=Vairimorpha necatrix TaxID=6039 RepID=A0AAX4JC67_9MICR